MTEILELPPPPPEASRILKMAEILEVKNYQRPTGAKEEEKGREGGREEEEKERGKGEEKKGQNSTHFTLRYSF